VCCVLRLSAMCRSANRSWHVRSRRKSARFLPCSADFVISRRLNDLVRARSARRDRQLGAHLDAQAAARQPALGACSLPFLDHVLDGRGGAAGGAANAPRLPQTTRAATLDVSECP